MKLKEVPLRVLKYLAKLEGALHAIPEYLPLGVIQDAVVGGAIGAYFGNFHAGALVGGGLICPIAIMVSHERFYRAYYNE